MVSMDAFARVISTPPTSNVARARQVTKKVSQGEFILDILIVVGRYEYLHPTSYIACSNASFPGA